MTVSKLIRELQKMEASGCGRNEVVVIKSSLWDGNDTFDACKVSKVLERNYRLCDDDGDTLTTKKGYERWVKAVFIVGENGYQE